MLLFLITISYEPFPSDEFIVVTHNDRKGDFDVRPEGSVYVPLKKIFLNYFSFIL